MTVYEVYEARCGLSLEQLNQQLAELGEAPLAEQDDTTVRGTVCRKYDH